jgi:site-specific DNA recombinase
MMRVGIYIRVSTQRQAQSQTIEQQLQRLKSHFELKGWPLTGGRFFQVSPSGLKQPVNNGGSKP